MKRKHFGSFRHVGVAALALAVSGIGGVALSTAANATAAQPQRPAGSLTAFRSDAELRAFLERIRLQQRWEAEADGAVPYPPAPIPPAPPPANAAAEASAAPQALSITNNQTAGVDEGGIVKMRGETMVILRRGRLFTISLAGGAMRPVDSIDASPPGVDGSGDWYDEMLISGDRVIVVGYSYRRGGTEINRFRLDAAGNLRFEDAYHLRSNDYYSSRNYASRLIGNRLVYYTPLSLGWERRGDVLDALPGVRRWTGDASRQRFRRIATARQIFIPPAVRSEREPSVDTLHSVIDCDLTAPVLDCTATGVLGPSSRTFYVSGSAVYLWMSEWMQTRQGGVQRAHVYRLPLGRERPSAIAARGAPVDQFSFREDAGDGVLNVLVRAESGGDAMWRPEVSAGDVALLRLPIAQFGDGSREAPRRLYNDLPEPEGQNWSFQNRFVGDHILYGGGAYGEASGGSVFVAPIRGGAAQTLALRHAVERIEVMGSDAVVVGSMPGGALGFSAIDLRAQPRVADVYRHPAASQGETRSHAYFYRPDPGAANGSSGLLGLPVARTADPSLRRFFGSAAAMLFLRRDQRRFSPAGELDAQVRGVTDDNCRASCTDWYGNARPIFIGDRVFALLGYELVEGTVRSGQVREVGRINFAPRAAPRRPAG